MRCNQSLAVVFIMAAIVSECMTLPNAEAIRFSVSHSISWEIKEFWRTTVIPFWTWGENAKAAARDVRELALPASSRVPPLRARRVPETTCKQFTEPLPRRYASTSLYSPRSAPRPG